jgi:hypothetical protein
LDNTGKHSFIGAQEKIAIMNRATTLFLVLSILSLFHTTLAVCPTLPKVITDNDDTVVSGGRLQRGNGYFSGIDLSWTLNLDSGNVPYPGIGYFLTELARGPAVVPPATFEDIIVSTARPDLVCPPFCISQTDPVALEIKKGGGKMGPVLYGEIDDVFDLDAQERKTEYAESKHDEIIQFMNANPNKFKYFLVGDNAHGDVLLSKMLLTDTTDRCVAAAFIHDVHGAPKRENNELLVVDLTGVPNIYFFRSAAHAAKIAHEKGFISKAGLLRVINGIKATTQYQSCSTTCICNSGWFCFRPIYKCSCPINGCQADRTTGKAPGCIRLVPDVIEAQNYYNTLDVEPRTSILSNEETATEESKFKAHDYVVEAEANVIVTDSSSVSFWKRWKTTTIITASTVGSVMLVSLLAFAIVIAKRKRELQSASEPTYVPVLEPEMVV